MRQALWAAALVVMVAGCGSSPAPTPVTVSSTTTSVSEPPTPTATATRRAIAVSGQVTLPSTGFTSTTSGAGDSCTGAGEFDDVGVGAQLVVRDGGTGQPLALGVVGGGTITADATCTFAFMIFGVPTNHASYTFEVAGRGETEFTRAELDDELELTLA